MKKKSIKDMIKKLNRYGISDGRIAKYCDVHRTTVCGWKADREPIPAVKSRIVELYKITFAKKEKTK